VRLARNVAGHTWTAASRLVRHSRGGSCLQMSVERELPSLCKAALMIETFDCLLLLASASCRCGIGVFGGLGLGTTMPFIALIAPHLHFIHWHFVALKPHICKDGSATRGHLLQQLVTGAKGDFATSTCPSHWLAAGQGTRLAAAGHLWSFLPSTISQ
jgi:hypothetical protein